MTLLGRSGRVNGLLDVLSVSLERAFASATCASSASSTFVTCWLTIGWKTRWPIEPIGPATRTSASQRMLVRSPSGIEMELGQHVHDGADALPFRAELRVVDRPLLDLLERELQLQTTHAERHLDRCAPVVGVLHLEALDARAGAAPSAPGP